jgi:DNA-directed RNA polymerase specialized sigma24 family protein
MDDHRLRRRAADLVARLDLRPRVATDADAAERISVWKMVDRLPSRQRQVLYLRYRADMTFDHIAAVMGITSSAARTHASLACVRLRAILEEGWND